MEEVINFLNANRCNINSFEGKSNYVLIHMKNGYTIEFFSDKELLAHHYND